MRARLPGIGGDAGAQRVGDDAAGSPSSPAGSSRSPSIALDLDLTLPSTLLHPLITASGSGLVIRLQPSTPPTLLPSTPPPLPSRPRSLLSGIRTPNPSDEEDDRRCQDNAEPLVGDGSKLSTEREEEERDGLRSVEENDGMLKTTGREDAGGCLRGATEEGAEGRVDGDEVAAIGKLRSLRHRVRTTEREGELKTCE